MKRILRWSPILLMLFLTVSNVEAQRPLHVYNIDGLYAAVSDPANAGKTVMLAGGTYFLTANDGNGQPRPNRGRLELQENMSLIGVEGDRNAAVIDASQLPVASYQGGGVPLTGAIRMGRGTNTVSWITVKNAAAGSAGIETDLVWPGTAYVYISHSVFTGNVRGIDVRNFGAAASGETIEAELTDNDFIDNTLGLSEGLRLGNFQGATGSMIKALMIGNRSSGNDQGRLIVNNRALNSSIDVVSRDNMFTNNGAGTIIVGGLSSNETVANGNSINFTAFSDYYTNNRRPAVLDVGGVVAVGGENISIPNGTNNNTVNVTLWYCAIINNQQWDVGAIGARSAPESVGNPGMNNQVFIQMIGSGGRGFVSGSQDTIPFNPSAGNSATLLF